MTNLHPAPSNAGSPIECPNGICDRLQIAEWDVQILKTERDMAIAAATMNLRAALGRLDHLLAAPGGLSVPEMQTEGRRIIKEALR